MDINAKGSKIIFITLGIILLVFLFVFGINTYYKEDEGEYEINKEYAEMVKIATEESDLCLFGDLEDDFRLCCRIEEGFKFGFYYDCTSQEYFEPDQQVYVILNALKFDTLYNPYFTQIYSELRFDYNQETISILGTQNLSRKKESLLMFSYLDQLNNKNELDNVDEFGKEGAVMKITGSVPQEGESFVMLAIAVYPDDDFKPGEKVELIIHHEAKIFKE